MAFDSIEHQLGTVVIPFGKIQGIAEVLRIQWSSLFQRWLNEQRISRTWPGKRLKVLTEQFEDLQTAIFTTIGTTN